MTFRQTYPITSYPAYNIIRVVKAAARFNKDLMFTALEAGDQLALDSGRVKHGHHYQIGSVISSSLKDDRDPLEAVERAIKNGHEMHFIFGLGTTLTSHMQNKKTYIEINLGDIVRFEGKYFTIEKAPNNNLRFEPFTQGEK